MINLVERIINLGLFLEIKMEEKGKNTMIRVEKYFKPRLTEQEVNKKLELLHNWVKEWEKECGEGKYGLVWEQDEYFDKIYELGLMNICGYAVISIDFLEAILYVLGNKKDFKELIFEEKDNPENRFTTNNDYTDIITSFNIYFLRYRYINGAKLESLTLYLKSDEKSNKFIYTIGE